MSDCVFCKIISGEISSEIICEDDKSIAFRDNNPQAPVHLLVVPREHIESAADISPENASIVADCFELIAKLAKRDELSGGFRVINNCGKNAGQTVPHIHFHVLAGEPMGERII